MAGCRALSNNEVEQVIQQLKTTRDRAFFVLGLKSGFRLSELLSLTIADVSTAGCVHERVKVQKRNTKGKIASREVVLHVAARTALQQLVNELSSQPATCPLFQSRNSAGGRVKAVSTSQMHAVLKAAYASAGVQGSVATHSMRKSFAVNVHRALGNDLHLTAKVLGHTGPMGVINTVRYLPVNQSELDAAVLAG